MIQFDEHGFRRRVEEAVVTLQKLLHSTRRPTFAEDVPNHSYQDKYLLAEFLTNCGLAAQCTCLEALGVGTQQLATLVEWSASETVTLRLAGRQRCTFLREEEREVESKAKVVKESTIFGKSEQKVVTRVNEWFWKIDVEWELVAYAGTMGGPRQLRLQGRSGSAQLKTTTSATPEPAGQVEFIPTEVPITWLLQQVKLPGGLVGAAHVLSFKIDRDAEGCRTPRRNPQVEAALHAARELCAWSKRVCQFMNQRIFSKAERCAKVQAHTGRDGFLALIASTHQPSELFVPVLPLFEARPAEEEADAAGGDGDGGDGDGTLVSVTAAAAEAASTPVLRIGDINAMLAEQRRALEAKWATLADACPPADDGSLLSPVELKLSIAVKHLDDCCSQLSQGVDYIEAMLKKQLLDAVGRLVTPADFQRYMDFHGQRLFKPEYAPKPFCFAVRRPDHYPEGTLTIEHLSPDRSRGAIHTSGAIHTICRRVAEPVAPMSFALDAATRVSFTGERFVHAYLAHQFGDPPSPPPSPPPPNWRSPPAPCTSSGASVLMLGARARQFSSFMLLLGRMGPAGTFEQKHALILQNKDAVDIPLMLEALPSATEFRDAISSLSPEQQRFAKAYRAMQLEGSVFGILVIQLKPQLEALLKLPHDALTKEIALTQQLLDLFIQYQIPSDLLTYAGPASASPEEKLEAVRGHVAAIYKMVEAAKEGELHAARQEAMMEQPFHQEYAESFGDTSAGCFPSGEARFAAMSADSDETPLRRNARSLQRRCSASAGLLSACSAPPPRHSAARKRVQMPVAACAAGGMEGSSNILMGGGFGASFPAPTAKATDGPFAAAPPPPFAPGQKAAAPEAAAGDAAGACGGSLSSSEPHVTRAALDDLVFRGRLGSGLGGSTYLAEWRGEVVAAKVASGREDACASWNVEVGMLAGLSQPGHPNVVRLLGAVEERLTRCVILEYCDGGDLQQALQRPTPRRFFFRVASGVAAGLTFLHANGVMHRDLKSPNVLLHGEHGVKIADFGLAAGVQPTGLTRTHCLGREVLTPETGTYRWMAPEIVMHEAYSKSADVFSYAMILFELITHTVPFSDRSALQAAVSIGLQGKRPRLPAGTPTLLRDLVESCWAEDIASRPRALHLESQVALLESTLSPSDREWLECPLGNPVLKEEPPPPNDNSGAPLAVAERRRRRSHQLGCEIAALGSASTEKTLPRRRRTASTALILSEQAASAPPKDGVCVRLPGTAEDDGTSPGAAGTVAGAEPPPEPKPPPRDRRPKLPCIDGGVTPPASTDAIPSPEELEGLTQELSRLREDALADAAGK